MIMLKTDLSLYDKGGYKPGASWLKRGLWYMVNILFLINPLNPFSCIKRIVLRIFGAKVGKSVVIKPWVNIKYPWHLKIGDFVWIGERVWIDNLGEVSIGDHSCLSQDAMILCGNHDFTVKSFNLIVENITIHDGVWIGARSVVCPGVAAGSHSVLTAGSIATKDMEPYGIYQGNPAVLKKKREIRE